jgi:hypothetical protein
MSPNGTEGQWRVRVAAGEYGPLDAQTLERWVREQRIGPGDLVYSPLSGGWMPAASVPQLGHLFASQQIGPPPHPGPRILGEKSPCYGVKGWLLFFCVLVVIVNPLAVLYGAARVLRMVDQFLGPDDPLKQELIQWTLAGAPVVVLGMVAGLRLFALKRSALMLARIYLVLNLAVGLVGRAFGPHYGPLQEAIARQHDVKADFAALRMRVLVFQVAWFLLWFTYFWVSKRVKATFGKQPVPSH